jgi:hypothetical protein
VDLWSAEMDGVARPEQQGGTPMRVMVAIQAGALALLASPALAGPFHHGGCCGGDCPQPQYRLKAEVEERVCTVETPVRNPVVVRTTVTEKDAPCTRMAPACVGPHCGGTHTALQAQTVPGKVRHISIEVCPPEKEWGVKKEDKVERCITISIQRLPDVVPTHAPCPAGPAH